MFEIAARMKYRFTATKGNLNVENLWDLSLKDLNEVAVGLDKQIKAVGEESFIEEAKADPHLLNRFEIVKYVIQVKLTEAKERENAVERKQKRDYLLNLINDKQTDADRGKTIKELRKELKKL